MAGFGDLDGAGDGIGKVLEQPRHFRGRLEVPFGIDGEPQAGFGQCAFFPHAGEHVGERPALRCVIDNVVDGNERRAELRAEFGQQSEPARLVAAMIMGAGEKGAAGRGADQGCEAGDEVVSRSFPRKRESRAGSPLSRRRAEVSVQRLAAR